MMQYQGPALVVNAGETLATWYINLSPSPGDTLPSLLTATSITMTLVDSSNDPVVGSPFVATATSATQVSVQPPPLVVGNYTAQVIANWSDGGQSVSSDIPVIVVTASSGEFITPNTPNIVDFTTFLNATVQIPTAALPVGSPWPSYALTQAIALTPCGPGGIMYTLIVYNCATHILFAITPDVGGQNYFKTKRAPGKDGFSLILPSTGLVAATSDESTSTTYSVPDWTKKITASQLQFMKTPWGREYLGWIQMAGPNTVGLT